MKSDLHPLHLEDLRRSGLSDVTVELMACRSVPAPLPGVESALELPYYTAPGFSRYKLFPALGDMKYYQPRDSDNHLYILPSVVKVLTDVREKIWFVEGEKKAAAGVQAGLNAFGFGGIWNWKESEHWRGTEEFQLIPFADRDVEIIPDSDVWIRDDLQHAVYAFAKYLEIRGGKISIVLIPQPEFNQKVGLDDFLFAHSIDDFYQLKRLTLKHAALSQHKDWHDNWKRNKEKESQTGDGLQGKPLFLREIEPHGEPVDGAELLIEFCRAIRRYVVAENADIVAIVLWCVHAHALDAFGISPFLNLSSPEKGCGKSTTLCVVSRALPRPLLSGNVSPASIFRAIDKYKPTFLVDEADTFQNLNDELRGLLNASHLRETAQAIRTVGDDHESRAFSTWCPKAISLIGRLPPTLEDRSIVIEMKRRRKDEACDRFSVIEPHLELEILGQKVARWVKENFDALRQARPTMNGIDNRLFDNWFPLLAVADVASGEWPKWIRIAARRFVAKAAESASIKVELLMDLAEIMGKEDRMFSEDIVKALNAKEDRPWPTFSRGKPITQVQVGRMVRGFAIKSKNIRIKDKQAKGYEAAEIGTALNRYAPASEASQASQEIMDNEIKELEAVFGTLHSVPEKDTDPSQAKQNGNGHGHDAGGFDWTNGEQKEETVDEYWNRVKAERAVRRAAGH